MSIFRLIKESKRKSRQRSSIDWRTILINEKYAIKWINQHGLLTKVKCGRKGCQKYWVLTTLKNKVIMRCPNFKCFRSEKDNKNWFTPKLKGFEHFKLNIGELLYLVIFSFLNKHSYERIQQDTAISSATYSLIKTKIREVIRMHFDNQPQLGENGQIVEIDESKFVRKKFP